MNTQKTVNRSLKFIVKVILGFIIGISFGFGVTKLVKTNSQLTASIESNIQQDTNFESVEKHISNVAILKEGKRINDSLKIAFDNYEVEDIIVIKFKTIGKTEPFKIGDGSIL